MRLQARRRSLVVWSSAVGRPDRHSHRKLARLTHHTRAWRARRHIRVGALLTAIGLIRLGRAVRPRWQPLAAGTALVAIGLLLHGRVLGVAFLPGLLFLWHALLIPGSPDADGRRRSDLERQLAEYSTPAQRRDLEATFDRYPDRVTSELREILASQAPAAGG
jgi:hypothetical protein